MEPESSEDAESQAPEPASTRRWGLLFGLLCLGLSLFVPERAYEPTEGAGRAPFRWDQDSHWRSLERRFADARRRGCPALSARIEADLAAFATQIEALSTGRVDPTDPRLFALEASLFPLAAELGACPQRVPRFLALYERMRAALKRHSESWSLRQRESRDRLYRLLYGGRMAAEELLLQQPEGQREALSRGVEEPSACPAAELLGVPVHSGDILLSRGGAPTSAMIARGNDYPGNFSHVALVHVDPRGRASTIESHIERGVVVAPLSRYLEDRKLRVLILRARADHPALRERPELPHQAAEWAVREATRRHIPYDFGMDYEDEDAFFCSEVASAAYRHQGLELWEGLSSMSSRGLIRRLALFGVRHFTTHGPSDLEYDPTLRVVAEWRDPAELLHDHMDNAVVDVMLEAAERGERLGFALHLLPVARAAKAYSLLLNLRGEEGPIPEGMSATTGLRVWRLRDRHEAILRRLRRLGRQFREREGYQPPYWELVSLAREAARAEASAR